MAGTTRDKVGRLWKHAKGKTNASASATYISCIAFTLNEPLDAKYSYTRYKLDILFHINKKFLGSTYGYPHSSLDKHVIHIISKRS